MRPIKITDKLRAEYLKTIEKQLKDLRSIGKIAFTFEPATQRLKDTIILDFTAMAWLKMWTLVNNCKTECAWHGVVEASDDRACFIVKDILVYPQRLAAATVEDDDENNKYEKWHQSLDNDTYNNLRFQGHSHVNFGTTPSGRDNQTYESILNNLREDSFYIFMIANKKENMWVNIYDLKNNAIYDEDDIDITVDGENLDEWYAVQSDEYFAKPARKPAEDWREKYDKGYGTFIDRSDEFNHPRYGNTMNQTETQFFKNANDAPKPEKKVSKK